MRTCHTTPQGKPFLRVVFACHTIEKISRDCEISIHMLILGVLGSIGLSTEEHGRKFENTEGPCLTRFLGLGKNRVT